MKMAHWLFLLNRWLESWVGRLYLASAVAVVYLHAYQKHGSRPGISSAHPLGWWGWWDQGQYLKCAAALAHGSLTPDTYWYPLGYPALGALFYRFMPQDAFFVPNLLLVVGITLLFFEIARRLISSSEAVLLIITFVVCYHGTLSMSLVEPWNTIPTNCLSYAIILLVGLREPGRNGILIGALCVGLIYLCRPPDAVCIGLVVAVALLRLPDWREKIKIGLAALAILVVFVGGVLLLNQSVFGSWRTPYEINSASIGFGSYPFTEKIFWLVVDGDSLFHLTDAALLRHFPWLILLPPGVIYFVRQSKWRAISILLSLGTTYSVYFAYNDFWPVNIFHYHLIHYLFWTLPLLFLMTYVGLREAWKDKIGRWSFAAILLMVFPACFLTLNRQVSGRIVPSTASDPKIPLAAESGVDWIVLDGSSREPKLLRGDLGLRFYFDFVRQHRRDGVLILLSTAARKSLVTVETREMPDLRAIDYGTFRWQLQWPPRPFAELEYYWSRPEIVSLGKIKGVDLAGPGGIPDGEPDQVIQIDLNRARLERISDWDIETTDRRGHWVSKDNQHGWWLIKIAPESETQSGDRKAHLRLCFPDHGDFERASAFTLRAVDSNGNILIDQTVRK